MNWDNYEVFALPLNPEPWAVGHISVVRRSGKYMPDVAPELTLQTYQNAVRDELTLQGAEVRPGSYSLYFSFSRHLAKYKTPGNRTSTRNASDATNMQKATEDALQGVLIDNDRDVVRVGSVIIDQGPEVTPFVIIELMWGLTEEDPSSLHDAPRDRIDQALDEMIETQKIREAARNRKDIWKF